MSTKKTSIHSIIIFILTTLFLFYKYTIEVSPSVMGNELASYYDLSATGIGNLAASYFYAYLIMQIPGGILLDKYGTKKVLTVSIVITATGSLISCYAPSVAIAWLGRFITGLGAATAITGCFKTITQWFPPNRFALMIGLTLMLGMLGSVNGQAPLAHVINQLHWQKTIYYIAIIGYILTIAFIILAKNKGPFSENTSEKTASIFDGLSYILTKKQPWLLSIYSGLAFAPLAVFGGLWGIPFLEASDHYTKLISAQAISMVFIGFALGSPILGWLSDQIKQRKPIMSAGTIIAFLISLVIVYIPNLPQIPSEILLFIFGFSLSAFLLCFTMLREITPLIFVATAIGFMNSFDAAISAITDPAIGSILDQTTQHTHSNALTFSIHSFQLGMSVLVIYLGLAIITLPFIKETYKDEIA